MVMRRSLLALSLVGMTLAGCSGSSHASPRSTSTTASAESTITVRLKECHSMHFLSQIQLDACAGEQEDAVARPLSKALATESTYWGTKVVAAVESQWTRYARAECLAETAENVGGTAYGMLFTACVTSVMQQRLATVQAVIAYLAKIQPPTYPAGRFPVTIDSGP